MKGNKIMESKELDYDTARRAVHGDVNAQREVLEFYDGYINALATEEEVTDEGNIRRFVDEDIKATIQMGYLEALPKCKVMQR